MGLVAPQSCSSRVRQCRRPGFGLHDSWIRHRITSECLSVKRHVYMNSFNVKPNGRNIAVTMENVDEYIHDILNSILGTGIQIQAKAFREGFSKVFPITDLAAFSSDELVMLFGNGDEDWSVESEFHAEYRFRLGVDKIFSAS